MKPTKAPKTPSYRLHKASGQAVVTLSGRDIYLGRYGTESSRREYDRVTAEWLAAGRQLPTAPEGLTVAMLVSRYWREHVESWYVKDGKPTSEQGCIRLAFRPLVKLYGDLLADEFGPVALDAVRNELIAAGWSRKSVNDAASRIKLMFKWAAAKELLSADVHTALSKLRGLAKGRSPAPEGEGVRPVPEAFIEAVRPFVGRHVAAMIDLQLLTGARPGEICILRGCDIDTSGPTWVYTPGRHKTEHHDKRREIYLGPKAQGIVREFLKPDLGAYLFSPAEAVSERHAEQARQRKTPVQPSQVRRKERAAKRAASGRRRRAPREHYTVDSYRRAIARACEEAFPPPEHLARRRGENRTQWRNRLGPSAWEELKAWQREHHWHPHQLRHNAATFLRRQYGIEVARVILGHSSALITEVYAEMDRATAAKIMAEVG